MAALWNKKKKRSKGDPEAERELNISSPEPLLESFFKESITVTAGGAVNVVVSKLDFEGFSNKILAQPDGIIVSLYSHEEECSGIFIFPKAFTSYYRDLYSNIVTSTPETNSKDNRIGALKSLLEKLPHLFSTYQGETTWEEGDIFPLFQNYSETTLIPILWKLSNHIAYEIEQEEHSFYCLIEQSYDVELRNNLKTPSFRQFLGALLFRKKGDTSEFISDDVDIDATLISIKDSRSFDLGPFVFPRLLNVAGQSIAAVYQRLGVGPVFPAQGVAFTWDFIAGVGKSKYAFSLVFVFPQLNQDKRELDLIKRLVVEAINKMTIQLSLFCQIQTTAKKLTKSFHWTEDYFTVELALDNNIQKIPLWVYGKRSWVEFLTKLFHLDILWDIRARSSRTFLLTLLNFNDGRLKQRLSKEIGAAKSLSEDGKNRAQEGQLLHKLFNSIPEEDARNIVQFFLIGKLGFDAAHLQNHFYYFSIEPQQGEEPPVLVKKMVPGFHDSQIFSWLPRLIQTDWKKGQYQQISLDDLRKINNETLSLIFQAHLKDNLKLGYQTKSLLNLQYLQKHNQFINQKIDTIKSSGKLDNILDDLDRRELEQIVMTSPNKEIAHAVVAHPTLLKNIRTSKKQTEDIEFFKTNVEKAIKLNQFNMEVILVALEGLIQKMEAVISKRKET